MRSIETPDASVLDAFGLRDDAQHLPGGGGRTFRCGDAVLRRVAPEDRAEAAWIAGLYRQLPHSAAFRAPRPLRAHDGAWLAGDGWTAWQFAEGRPATMADLPAAVAAIEAFHAAIADVPRPAYLVARNSLYDRADRGAWSGAVPQCDARLAPWIERLVALRRPLGLRDQLVHGDLNGENILIAPGLPPAIIDMAPYWRPPEFALAVTAFWMGTYRGDPSASRHFEHVPHFAQMLLRVCLRSLLGLDAFGNVDRMHEYAPAVDIVCVYAEAHL